MGVFSKDKETSIIIYKQNGLVYTIDKWIDGKIPIVQRQIFAFACNSDKVIRDEQTTKLNGNVKL